MNPTEKFTIEARNPVFQSKGIDIMSIPMQVQLIGSSTGKPSDIRIEDFLAVSFSDDPETMYDLEGNVIMDRSEYTVQGPTFTVERS
jgi:hypothetical protein